MSLRFLCRLGFHRWELRQTWTQIGQYRIPHGTYRCGRCGVEP